MSSNIGKNELSSPRIKGQHYDKCFIKEIVESIEKGVPRSEIVKQHGIGQRVLSDWMREYGSQTYHASKRGFLSFQQNRSIVPAFEEGRMTIAKARLSYGISSIRWPSLYR